MGQSKNYTANPLYNLLLDMCTPRWIPGSGNDIIADDNATWTHNCVLTQMMKCVQVKLIAYHWADVQASEQGCSARTFQLTLVNYTAVEKELG